MSSQIATSSLCWRSTEVCPRSPSLILVMVLDCHTKPHQPKASIMSHEVSLLPPSSTSHFNVEYTMKLLQTRGVSSSPAHRHDTTPHGNKRVASWKVFTPSLEGHSNLKVSGSQWYLSKISSSKALQGWTIVSIIALDVILLFSRGWMECKNNCSSLFLRWRASRSPWPKWLS
jgi:hypothetical protein